MPVIPEGIAYAYTHETTQATTGYFSCQPPASLTLPQALARLEATPFDDFLRQHCLRQLSRRSPEEIKNLADELYDRETDSFRRMGLAGLLLECSLLVPELAHCCDGFPEDALQRLTLSSSLIYLRAASRKDFGLMQAWSAHFADNIARHHMLPHWEELELELPYSEEELEVCREGLRARAGMLEREHARMQAEDLPRLERRPAQETYEQAVNALLENDVLAGQEMRHQASLSPIALLRSWKVDLAVDCGRMRHSLRGEATAYGRGLSLAAARASYAMEIVERASSYVSVARTGEHTFEVTNRRRPMPLVHASCAKLRSQGKDFLPLSSLPLETPFEDYVPLYWLEARDPEGKTVLVTGAAGSIGSEICRQLCTFGLKELVLFDMAETPMHNIRLELEDTFPNEKFTPVVGDIRVVPRLQWLMRTYKPQVIFHAAAYKHVPLMEENPCEAVLANVIGTRNLADLAVEYGVERFVMISTDKAVNPTNVMGASKRLR